MLQEIINAVYVTFVASEWLATDECFDVAAARRHATSSVGRFGAVVALANLALSLWDVGDLAWFARVASRPAVVAALEGALVAAAVLGAASRFPGGRRGQAPSFTLALGLFGVSWVACACLSPGRTAAHAPRLVLAAVAFVAALYADVARRRTARLSPAVFVHALVQAVLYVAPCYPILAIAISLGFLAVIAVFEQLRLDLRLLDAPIYYGCLYGPFAAVYVQAKKTLLAAKFRLPSTVDVGALAANAAIDRERCADPW